MAAIRYIVNDVPESIEFFVGHLGFKLEQQFGPAMAILKGQDIELLLAGPPASASQPMPDRTSPSPGGWNRLVVVVDDIEAIVTSLEEVGATFRNKPFQGPGGTQVLCEDPSGNPIELFQHAV